jgi:hypothetical protein
MIPISIVMILAIAIITVQLHFINIFEEVVRDLLGSTGILASTLIFILVALPIIGSIFVFIVILTSSFLIEKTKDKK